MGNITMYDLVTVGDTSLDIFILLSEEEAEVHCDMDKKNCRLGLSYAEKIPYEEAILSPASGNAANVAKGSARLGLKTSFYTVLGRDLISNQNKDALEANKVDTELLVFDDNPPNINIILSYKGERTILVKHSPHQYEIPEFETKWLYLTSLGEGHEHLHKTLPELIKKKKIKLAFNPGTPQIREGAKVLDPILKACEVLMVNKEEAQKLLSTKGDDFKKLLDELLKLGPKKVIITDASNGSYAAEGEDKYKLGVFEVKVVERTGAGDAFSSGVVSAFASGHDLTEAMRWGTFNSASVIQKVGAEEGLLSSEELEQLLEENKDFLPQKL